MAPLRNEISPIRDGLLQVGFDEKRLQIDVPIPGRADRVPLLAFSDSPFDSRTAAVAAMSGDAATNPDVAALRPLGAPIVFVCFGDHFQLWKQGFDVPQFHQRLTARELSRFFEVHREELAPRAIYRAKVWARLDRSFQLDFVDPSFLPLIEGNAGHKLTELVERVVATVKRQLGWRDVSDKDGRWLLQSVFWLLAAKILQDKDVPGFVRLNVSDVEDVYERVAKHYNSDSPRPIHVGSPEKKDALITAAADIKAFPHCGPVSTEALAYLYESALIDRTVRRKLGTHSTPTWLVDYIVGKLRPWVEHDVAVEDRNVFEPACGHAGFLISAMRLLSELLPSDWNQSRRTYLRQRLHGVEVDHFALEIARLSLTLADVPNANGWALTEANMFKGDVLERGVREATMVLGNPPFEDFVSAERHDGWLPNKAAETFRRVVENLQPGSVFGFVLPQTFLHAKQVAEVRKLLLRNCEFAEIDLFADKVFRYGEPESTILIGRRKTRASSLNSSILFKRVREGQIKEFSETYEAGTSTTVAPQRFEANTDAILLVPDLLEVWETLANLPRMSEFCDIGQGFSHKSVEDPTFPKRAVKESPVAIKDFARGFAGWRTSQMTHELPPVVWLNLDSDVILAPRWGTVVGHSQVLLNYARVSRQAWRVKALVDSLGHPVTSDFLVVRPKHRELPLEVFWALLNSPLFNAFAYCHSNKRHVLAGLVRAMPVPRLLTHDLTPLIARVAKYFEAAKPTERGNGKERRSSEALTAEQMNLGLPNEPKPRDQALNDILKNLHWRIDAEVLRLYNLPASLERMLLDLFAGIRRRGVPFEQTEYFPPDFTELDRLSELLAITADWQQTNRRRAKLIDLDEEAQVSELKELQRLADARVSLLKPRESNELDRRVESLRRKGVWME